MLLYAIYPIIQPTYLFKGKLHPPEGFNTMSYELHTMSLEKTRHKSSTEYHSEHKHNFHHPYNHWLQFPEVSWILVNLIYRNCKKPSINNDLKLVLWIIKSETIGTNRAEICAVITDPFLSLWGRGGGSMEIDRAKSLSRPHWVFLGHLTKWKMNVWYVNNSGGLQAHSDLGMAFVSNGTVTSFRWILIPSKLIALYVF